LRQRRTALLRPQWYWMGTCRLGVEGGGGDTGFIRGSRQPQQGHWLNLAPAICVILLASSPSLSLGEKTCHPLHIFRCRMYVSCHPSKLAAGAACGHCQHPHKAWRSDTSRTQPVAQVGCSVLPGVPVWLSVPSISPTFWPACLKVSIVSQVSTV